MIKVNLSKLTLFMYITFSSFSGYSLSLIQNIGKYGKIFTLLLSFYILFFITYRHASNFIKLLKKEKIFMYLFSSFLLGSLYGYIDTGNYIYIYYTVYINLSLLFIILIYNNLIYNKSVLDFFKFLEIIMLSQYIIGFILIIALNLSLYDTTAGGLEVNSGGLSGFLEKRNTFGLLSAVGFFISLYIYIYTGSFKSLVLICFYLVLVYLTKTRFVYIIILSFYISYIYYKIKNKIENKNLNFIIYIFEYFIIIIGFIFIILFFIENKNLIYEFTTGRLLVWTMFINEFSSDLIGSIIGHGSTYFSDLIIQKYSVINYYIRILDSLSLHSSYFKLLETGGIISLILFIYLNYRALKNANNYHKSIIIAFLIGGFVESYLLNPNTIASMFYWFIITINLFNKKGI